MYGDSAAPATSPQSAAEDGAGVRALVAALDSELQAFPAEIPGYIRVVTGLGKLNAAVGLTKALIAHPEISEIVVIGTAGGVDPDLAPGIYELGSAIQHDVVDFEGRVGHHIALPADVTFGDSGLRIATGDSFIHDEAVAATIKEMGATLVDMEAYVYAWVAANEGVPIRIYKAISDNASEGADKLWDEVVAECSAQLWQHFIETEKLDS